MSNPRYHPRSVRLWKLSSKCVDDQFLLAPTEEVYTLVMLFLAKMQELYDVELVAFVFMGNHFHIIVRLNEDRLPDIMRDFKGGLAKALNELHGRRGALWMERYDDDAVLDDDAAGTAVDYFHANPVRALLVQIQNAKFSLPAEPGDRIELEARLGSTMDAAAQVDVAAHVDGKKIARAQLTFMLRAVDSDKVHAQRRSLYALWTKHLATPVWFP